MPDDDLSGDDWTLVRDFDNADRTHSRPRFEARLTDGGETVFVRKTDPITGDETLQELPRDVAEGIVDRLPED